MSTLKEQWLQRRKTVRSLMPSLRIDSASLRYYRGQNRYEIIVHGINLRPSVAPPRVIVHGIAVSNLTFSADGTELRGRLPSLPPERDLLVDLGFSRSEYILPEQVTTVPSLRYGVELSLELIRKLFKQLLGGDAST